MKQTTEHQTMQAWVLHGIGDLRLEEREIPKPGCKEVLLAVKASGICGSDIQRIYENGTYSFPLIPGHEFSGQVVQVGEETQEWIGKRVGVFPLIPCWKCPSCQKRQYEMCRNYSYLGSRRNGGYAGFVAVPEANLIELPNEVSYEAAALLEPMAVAVHAMRRVCLSLPEHRKSRIVICGFGTVGAFLAMFLREAGFTDLLVIGNKDIQRHLALSVGISGKDYCDSRYQEAGSWIFDHTEGEGADVFFECVGQPETIACAVATTAPNGQIGLIGNPRGDVYLPKQVYWKLLRNQIQVRGSWNSTFLREPEDDWQYVLRKIQERTIIPQSVITHRFPFGELGKGLQMIRENQEEYMKVMVEIP